MLTSMMSSKVMAKLSRAKSEENDLLWKRREHFCPNKVVCPGLGKIQMYGVLCSKPGTDEHRNIRSWFQSASGIVFSQYSCFCECQWKPQPSWKRNQTNQTEKSWTPLISFHPRCQHPVTNPYPFLSQLLQNLMIWSPCTCSSASLPSTPQIKWFFKNTMWSCFTLSVASHCSETNLIP